VISYPSRHCTVELQALPSRIGQVRRILSAQLRYWHLDPLIDRAALGVTELLTNVHQHAQPDKTCTVEIELLLDRLTVSVHDHDPRLPVVADIDGVAAGMGAMGGALSDIDRALADIDGTERLATCGRGLAMVAAVSESWGARPDGESGKVVWFTLPTPAATRAARAGPVRRAVVEKPARTLVDVGSAVDLRRPERASARSAVVG
jgi:anti-sigma regulatory factor (Ser/Thr protein kinase)